LRATAIRVLAYTSINIEVMRGRYGTLVSRTAQSVEHAPVDNGLSRSHLVIEHEQLGPGLRSECR